MIGVAVFVDDTGLAGLCMLPLDAGRTSGSLDIVVGICSCVDCVMFIRAPTDPSSSTSVGLSLEICSASWSLGSWRWSNVVGPVAGVKAVACWSIGDPSDDGASRLATWLFAGVVAGANFLPWTRLLGWDSNADPTSTVSVDSVGDLTASSVSLTDCFRGFDFLGFDIDGCAITTASSSRVAAFLALPRLFTASLDMMAQASAGPGGTHPTTTRARLVADASQSKGQT